MKKATLVVSKYFLNNRIFSEKDTKLNRDNCLAPFISLKNEFLKHNIDLSTQDINPKETSAFIIYNDMPFFLPKKSEISKSYVLIMESPIVVKSSWVLRKHQFFRKIFTWKDSVIDQKKYFKINYTHKFPERYEWPNKREKLCTLISAHKLSSLKNELYSERIKSIRWFEKNHPNDFDLYGIGWDRPAFDGIFKVIKKIPNLYKLVPFKKFPSYLGPVASKNETFKKYDFAICYENVRDEDGYITEKIFDCFFAGTIPIYWGASNITDFVPANSFIDKRLFKNYEDLYAFLTKMSESDKNQYRENIKSFLQSELGAKFETESFAVSVCREVLSDIA